MITSVRLQNFKAFGRFRLRLSGDAYIAGANNAGKSTILAALRTAEHMIRLAARRANDTEGDDRGTSVPAYSFEAEQVGLMAENLRHEFRDNETRLEVEFSDGAHLVAVWPPDTAEPDGPFFYLVDASGTYLRRPSQVVTAIPPVGIVPVLAPLMHVETVLTEKHVRSNFDTRLASGHLRNQLYLLRQDEAAERENRLADFFEFAAEWLPEIELRELVDHAAMGGHTLDLYYRDPDSHIDKEIFWAGDGIQIWLQILFHLFRLGDQTTIVLDEPEVFLHPDIQRRLVRVLETLDVQAITATHSPEILAEADPAKVIWIERGRANAVSAPSTATLEELSRAIGTQFNLRLARALRSKVVLFVEGKDMRLVREIAATTGADRVAQEAGIAVIPLEGFSNWEHVEPFAWLTDHLLADSVRTVVVLDRDYRSDQQVAAIEGRLRAVGVQPHVWRRKELESYVLVPDAIARRTGTDVDWVRAQLDELAADMKSAIAARQLDERQRFEVAPDRDRVRIAEAFNAEFDRQWDDVQWRLSHAPPKELISGLNRRLQTANRPTISARKLAAQLAGNEISAEMRQLLTRVNGLAE